LAIFQASILKKYPAGLIVVFFYCFFVAILSGVTCLVVERDISAWSLEPKLRLLSVLYSVIKMYFWIEVQLIDSISSYALSLVYV
jgi:ABC-type microcin C transport system permease subunit YejE